MPEPIKMIFQGADAEIVEKKSRFIGQIFPIHSEEEAQRIVNEIRKKHYDARHHCFAYVLGEKNEIERCSDDGEPSGTAGRPMLDLLVGAGVHDALAVVTRYFGGVLLGTGGLVRAYSAATKEALQKCDIREKEAGYRTTILADYVDFGKIQYLAANLGLSEENVEYGEKVSVTYGISEKQIDAFEKEVINKTGGKCKIDRGNKIWIYSNT